ncbi:Nucleoporin NUP35 [Lamellibrachia satsuma]|nr:Nucleoporin NUP35 [Lamellibrachia satsuma]
MYRSEGMANVEPMLLGSPISPSGMNTSTSQSPFLPAYLMGEPAPMAQSPGGSRLWSASPVSGSPQKSLNRSGSLSSPMAQGSIAAFPHSARFDSRNRDLLGGRTKEKVGAPPIQGLLETIASPSPMTDGSKLDGSLRGGSFVGGGGSFVGTPSSAQFSQYTLANQTQPGLNQSAHMSQMIGQSAKTPPSPAQIDPFYTQGEAIKPDDELDETWVTVFGFPLAATSFVLQQFAQYGSILKHVVATDGNWMHIHFQSKIQARKALSKNGKVFGTGVMVGVHQCIDKVMFTFSHQYLQSSTEPTPSGSATTSMPVTPAHLQSSVNTASITSHVTTHDHWRAEVLWTMKVVSSHYSYVSCMETDRLFQLMFPDSAIAKSFSCGEKKIAYIICHRLAPYFTQQLKDQHSIDDVDSHLPHFQIDPGFCAAKKLKELAAVTSVKQKLSERERMAFRMECKKGLVCATQKLLEKCPITYTMTRNLTCLDPRLMAGRKDDCIAKFGRVLQKDRHQVRDADCDAIQQQFRSFVNEVVPANSTTFKDFNPDNERLDTFLAVYLRCMQYVKLWMVTKKLLILSHGQVTVERGFSINSHIRGC